MGIVSLVKSSKNKEGVFDSLELIKDEIEKNIKGKKNVVIKVNFVSSFKKVAATDVKGVTGLIEFLRKIYDGDIKVVEVGTVGGAEMGFLNLGYKKLSKEYGVKLVNLKKEEFEEIRLVDSMGDEFETEFSKIMLESDFLISIGPPKTHDTVVATLSLKNVAVGGLKRGSVIHQGKAIHENIVRICQECPINLAIIDGTWGMEGNGPISGTKINSGWVACSTDALAVDSLGVYLMGIEVENVGYMMRAKEKNLGYLYPSENIKIVGEKPNDMVKKFRRHESYQRQIKWR